MTTPEIVEIIGPIADSWMIQRGSGNDRRWLTPDRKWSPLILDAARFELTERDKAERWLERELPT